MPEYKGAPLDADRGPGLGCFWIQAVLLVALLVLTPLSVVWAWPSMVSAALLILSLVLLFFVGQTMKAMQGKANPSVVNELLKKALG